MSTSSLGQTLLGALLAVLCAGGCSTARELSACVPGRVESCPCSGGRSGTQACLANGTFGACVCEEVDASVGADASVVDASIGGDAAPEVDAAISIDAGSDAVVIVDAGPSMGTPS